jgi:four helix bundle protein
MELVVAVYERTAALPDDERFGLAAQMRRAAVSIPCNIAEGHAFRTTPRAYLRHVRIALGSFAELETQTELLVRLRLADEAALVDVHRRMERTGRLLHGLLRALRTIEPK